MLDVSDTIKQKYLDGSSHDIQYYIEVYTSMDMDGHTPIMTITNEYLEQEKLTLDEGLCDDDGLSVGSVYTAELTFTAAQITSTLVGKYLNVYQVIDGETDEPIQMGKFQIISVTKTSDKTRKDVVAYDYTVLFDEDGTDLLDELRDASTIAEALSVVATHFNLEVAEQTFTGQDYAFAVNDDEVGEDDTYTCRDLVAMIGELIGGWVKVNRYGQLQVYFAQRPDTSEMHSITYYRTSPNYEEYETQAVTDVTYTFVDDTVYTASNDDTNSLDLSDNFFANTSTISKYLSLCLSNLASTSYYPVSMKFSALPYLEVGDWITFSDDTESKTMYTLVKAHKISGIQAQADTIDIQGAETLEASYTGKDRSSSIVNMVKRTNYLKDQLIADLADKMASASGLYQTVEETETGGSIYYMHNKPTLEESDIVWKMTADAFAVSTDGGVTWNAGLTVDGNLVANLIAATGISADWIVSGALSADYIEGGTLVIGGDGVEADGSIAVYNASGNLICSINKDGLYAILGEIAGWTITATKMVSSNGLMEINSSSRRIICGDTDGTQATYSETGESISYDGEAFGEFGFRAIYWTDDDGTVTSNLRGYILAPKIYNTDNCLGYGIVAWSQEDEWYQRMMFYDQAEEWFYFYRPVTLLCYTETDPYWVKDITFDDDNQKFTVTTGRGGYADTSNNITNTFTYEMDSDGNITSITNTDSGKVMTVNHT